jgi:hypothetical protein
MAQGKDDDRPTSRGALITALVVSFVVGNLVPFGGLILYPFTLMATWVHEMGHGLASLCVGGGFERLEIFGNASGLAHTTASQHWDGVVCAGGLLAPPLLGATILATARGPKRARVVLAVLAAVMLASLVIWVRTFAGWVALPLVAGLLGVFARWASPRELMFLAQFLGLRLALDTVTRIDYVFSDKATVDGLTRASDIARVAASFGGPRLFWSLVVAGISFGLVAAGVYAAYRTEARPKSTARKAARIR